MAGQIAVAVDSRPKYREVRSSSERAACITPNAENFDNQLLSFFVRRGTKSYDEFIAAVPFRPRLSMILGMINTTFSRLAKTQVRVPHRVAG